MLVHLKMPFPMRTWMDGESGEIESIFAGNGKSVINGAAVKTIGFSGERRQENNQPIILNTTYLKRTNHLSYHWSKKIINQYYSQSTKPNGKCNHIGQTLNPLERHCTKWTFTSDIHALPITKAVSVPNLIVKLNASSVFPLHVPDFANSFALDLELFCNYLHHTSIISTSSSSFKSRSLFAIKIWRANKSFQCLGINFKTPINKNAKWKKKNNY